MLRTKFDMNVCWFVKIDVQPLEKINAPANDL